MTDVFKVKEKELHDGILLESHFDKGYCGTVYIYPFEALSISPTPQPTEGSRVHLSLQGKEWCGAFENSSYGFKTKQPYNRGSQTTYLGHDFSILDIIPTRDGGRFLSLKKLMGAPSSTSVDYYPDREKAMLYPASDLEVFSQGLGTILELTGVPPLDVPEVQRDVFSKLGYNKSRIASTYPHVDICELFKYYVNTGGRNISNISEVILHLSDQGLSKEEIAKRLFEKNEK